MINYNSNDIFVGYIKQLLNSFNLPTLRVYSKRDDLTGGKYIIESCDNAHPISSISPEKLRYVPYIKDDNIMYYHNGLWTRVKLNNSTYNDRLKGQNIIVGDNQDTYYYNKKILNYTKNFQIKNNTYDKYTHEYLGDYLRFLRDYNNIDLMSLYNCFTNSIVSNLDMTLDLTSKPTFKSSDNTHIIYDIPVKLGRKYLIAIDCPYDKVEVCCGIYSNLLKQNLDTNDESKRADALVTELSKSTYKSFRNMAFNSPIYYDKLEEIFTPFDQTNQKTILKLSEYEKDLKMFLKVPKNLQSSIVILEVDNLHNIKKRTMLDNKKNWYYKTPELIYNWGELDTLADTNEIVFGTVNQLLEVNDGKSYPFADRLVEYLVGNVITHLDFCEDNISRVQRVADLSKLYKTPVDGAWDQKLRFVIDRWYENKVEYGTLDNFKDFLGYVDKDIENNYYETKVVDGVTEKVYLKNYNLYEENN